MCTETYCLMKIFVFTLLSCFFGTMYSGSCPTQHCSTWIDLQIPKLPGGANAHAASSNFHRNFPLASGPWAHPCCGRAGSCGSGNCGLSPSFLWWLRTGHLQVSPWGSHSGTSLGCGSCSQAEPLPFGPHLTQRSPPSEDIHLLIVFMVWLMIPKFQFFILV